MQDTPAQKAGMRKGDVVIRINDKLIQNSNHLRNEIANAGAYAEIEMELIRDGKTVLLKLKLDERPNKIVRMKTSPEPTQTTEQFELLGMTVEELTEENAKQLGIEPGIGVVISNVKSGSPAEKSGLLPGMIVLEAERKAVRNIDTFKEIMNDIDQGKGILLLIRTSNGSSYLFLKENWTQ